MAIYAPNWEKDEVKRILESDKFIDFGERYDAILKIQRKRLSRERGEIFSEGFEAGFEEAKEEIEEAKEEALTESYDRGFEAGHIAGNIEGENIGYVVGKKDGYKEFERKWGEKLIAEYDRGVAFGKQNK